MASCTGQRINDLENDPSSYRLKSIFWLKSRGFWCCKRFGLKEPGPLESGLFILVQVHIGNFFNKEIEGASESIIEKLCIWTRTKNNQLISNQISMVSVYSNQNSDHIKTHAIWAKKIAFKSIWTRTIFEFIFALACI